MFVESHNMTQRRSRRSGFTLVEVLVAVGVGGIVFLSLYTGLAQGFSYVKRAHERLRATQILTEKLEVTRLYSWSQINTPGFIPATFTEYYYPITTNNPGIAYTGTFIVTNAVVSAAYQDNMRRAIVEITWGGRGITNRQSMETLISEYGVQNYIY